VRRETRADTVADSREWIWGVAPRDWRSDALSHISSGPTRQLDEKEDDAGANLRES